MGKKYQQVYDYLIKYIQDNHLKPSDKLPTENEISEQLMVSRTTIQRAIRELIQNKMIYRIQGGGTYLSEKQSAQPFISFIPLVISNQDKATGFYDYISGAESFLGEHSCYLTVHCSRDDSILERQIIERLIHDGARCIMLIATANSSTDFFMNHIQNGVRFIFLDHLPLGVRADLVTSDNIAGGIAACEHLIKLGHQRIRFVTAKADADNINTVQDRQEGYCYAMRAHGLQQYCRSITFQNDKAHFRDALANAFQAPDAPTALFAANDSLAGMIILALSDMGLSTPKDVSVIGFDGKALASAFHPQIATVEQQFFSIGYQAAELAYRHLEEAGNVTLVHRYLAISVLPGESAKPL